MNGWNHYVKMMKIEVLFVCWKNLRIEGEFGGTVTRSTINYHENWIVSEERKKERETSCTCTHAHKLAQAQGLLTNFKGIAWHHVWESARAITFNNQRQQQPQLL